MSNGPADCDMSTADTSTSSETAPSDSPDSHIMLTTNSHLFLSLFNDRLGETRGTWPANTRCHRCRLHSGKRVHCPGTFEGTGANIRFCPGSFQAVITAFSVPLSATPAVAQFVSFCDHELLTNNLDLLTSPKLCQISR